ncbi:MAG: DNA repair protein RecN [Candidatus Aminicenantes bacterium]|nr:MAG: DNA repair protein RecN [Candidatus Aminicenantes bacterium]
MIKSFRITNLATIEEVEFNLKKGFSIMTGETGAGKSIIIDGIRLVLGEKGSSDMIRTGKKETTIEAIFRSPSDPENEIFVQRKIVEQGTGKGYVDGVLVPLKTLKSLRDDLVDIYGQNDHAFLRHVENQLDYLDYYAHAFSLRKKVADKAQELRKKARKKRDLESKQKEREQRLDFLNYQITEIQKAELQPDEEQAIRQDRNILKNAEKISLLIDEALKISYQQEHSASSLLSKLQAITQELSRYEKSFKPTEEAIRELAIIIEDLTDSLLKFKEKQTSAPDKLEKLESRLSQIEGLKRKYGNSILEILSYLEKSKQEFEELSRSHETMADLEKEIADKFSDLRSLTEKLAEKRRESALILEKAVKKEICLLGMKRARFKIDIKTILLETEHMEKIKDSGTEEVEFLISPNPGEELRPLRKIASGGELSRIMLALKSIGKETESLKTLIFDEIDAGIGGKTAEFVAQKLQNLADHHQVICITHLPQIASFAAHHYRIDKQVKKDRTFTIVKELSFEERVQEIARLLTGSRVTDTALKNAREMLIHNLNTDHS